jgi:hypothetical protein
MTPAKAQPSPTTTAERPTRSQKKLRARAAAAPRALGQTDAIRSTAASVSPPSASVPATLTVAPSTA